MHPFRAFSTLNPLFSRKKHAADTHSLERHSLLISCFLDPNSIHFSPLFFLCLEFAFRPRLMKRYPTLGTKWPATFNKLQKLLKLINWWNLFAISKIRRCTMLPHLTKTISLTFSVWLRYILAKLWRYPALGTYPTWSTFSTIHLRTYVGTLQ